MINEHEAKEAIFVKSLRKPKHQALDKNRSIYYHLSSSSTESKFAIGC